MTWRVPQSWAWRVMGDISQVVGGGTPRTTDRSNFENGSISWITPADLSGYNKKYISKGKRNITEKGLASSSARLMPEGTVLFSSRAPIGYVAISANPVSTNQGFKNFVLFGSLSPDYVYYYLLRARQLALDLASGTTFQEISGRQAAKIPVPIAPLPEQHRIVEAIESYFTRLDSIERTLGVTLAKVAQLRRSILVRAFEGKLVPQDPNDPPASVLLERIKAEREAMQPRKRRRTNKKRDEPFEHDEQLDLLGGSNT